jgi:predicted DNA-binding transcriptional regulator AlpA
MQAPSERTRKLSVSEAAQVLGMSVSWMNKRRTEGGGPPFHKFGRRVLYDSKSIEEWAESNRIATTAQQIAAAEAVTEKVRVLHTRAGLLKLKGRKL